jgi:hypothetical protein
MSNQVVKIELKGKRFLELLQTVLKDELPADASVEAVYHNPALGHGRGAGSLEGLPGGRGWRSGFYARALDLISAKEFKTVIEQGQAAITPK